MQEAIVAVIVGFAVLAVLRRYMPKVVRHHARAVAVRLLKQLGWHGVAGWFDTNPKGTGSSCADGCGTCGGCGSNNGKSVQNEFAITADTLKRTARH